MIQVGLVGLGKMGVQIARRLTANGSEVVGCDPSGDSRGAAAALGVATTPDLDGVVARLSPPRAVWVMVPAGPATEEVVATLVARLSPGDLVVEGGNSHYRDSIRRAEAAERVGIGYLDCGTSGGIRGGDEGFCLMVGGTDKAFSTARPILEILAQEQGYLHVGRSGAGHYVKMVHNAVEYALMEAYGEGFELLAAKREFEVDLEAVARLWGRGSIVRSFLLELAAEAFERDRRLDGLKGFVADSGEGRWAAVEALELGVPAPGIMLALAQRHRSRQVDSFSAKVVAALRKEFGGHEVKYHDR